MKIVSFRWALSTWPNGPLSRNAATKPWNYFSFIIFLLRLLGLLGLLGLSFFIINKNKWPVFIPTAAWKITFNLRDRYHWLAPIPGNRQKSLKNPHLAPLSLKTVPNMKKLPHKNPLKESFQIWKNVNHRLVTHTYTLRMKISQVTWLPAAQRCVIAAITVTHLHTDTPRYTLTHTRVPAELWLISNETINVPILKLWLFFISIQF